MSTAMQATGTAAFKGPAALRAAAFDPTFLRAVLAAAAAFSTATPAPAAATRYEDTAARANLRPAGLIRIVEREESAAIKRIQALANYSVGWNGPDSMGPTLETVRQATAFAQQLAELGDIAQPYISLADDGEINFYWKTEAGLTMDLGFTGSSQYSYFAETRDGLEFIEDGANLGQPLPAELIAALRA